MSLNEYLRGGVVWAALVVWRCGEVAVMVVRGPVDRGENSECSSSAGAGGMILVEHLRAYIYHQKR
jgi:hypothetical protein